MAHPTRRLTIPDSPDPRNHYYLQLNRRFRFLENWRRIRGELAKGENVRMTFSPTRNLSIGMLVGAGAEVPSQMIDARILELAPDERTSAHRHLHDAVIFVLQGEGVTVIDGRRCEWGPMDTLHTPAWSWHWHESRGSTVRLLAVTDAPLLRALRLDRIEDVGQAAPGFESVESGRSNDRGEPSAYEMELIAAERAETERQETTGITRFSDVELRVSPKGTRTALMVDRSLGFNSSGLSLALFEMPPGKAQSKHRHPGEAILYIVSGRGYSVINDAEYQWETGDAVVVHQYVWHQHFNADPDRPAVVLRLHMWESIIEIMQAAMDPVPLYEDAPEFHERGAVWEQVTPAMRSGPH